MQSCNSSPFTTTDFENPNRDDYPDYMIREIGIDRRRSKRSRQLLCQAQGITLDDFEKMAFDTGIYWRLTELENWQKDFAELARSAPDQAAKVKPYLDHLTQWDGCADIDSTGAALCITWYEELYGGGQAEDMKSHYQDDSAARLMALVKAGQSLQSLFGDWKVPWGNVHRLQRTGYATDTVDSAVLLLWAGKSKSVPLAGAPGPMGVVFTIYSTPSIPLIRPQRFAVVGCSYMAAIEFGPKVRARSLAAYGTNGNPWTPHFDDQRQLMSERRFKTSYYYLEQVLAAAERSYHPGQR